MATISNLVSGTYSSGAVRNTQEQMNELRNQFKGKEIDSDEYREKMSALKDQREEARMNAVAAGLNAANNVSSLFSYMNNTGNSPSGVWGSGTFDNKVFISSGSELSTLQAMNSARIGIENRARTLVGEIGRDRARGMDVSDRQEALANLTGNLNILNRNLSGSIDKALADGKKDSNFIDIVGKIRNSLAVNETEEGASPVTVAETPVQPSFAAPPQFEGGAAEQAVAASQEQNPDEMSIAAQIANNAQSEYAESVNIMNEEEVVQAVETPEQAMEMGVTPANV